MENLVTEIAFIIFIIMGAIIHEYCHGWAANEMGDSTAKDLGRLTLNPLAHIDPIGSILLPVLTLLAPGNFLFAYAKPVPYNPRNLKYQTWGPALVGIAGPLSNLVIAFTLGLVMRFAPLSEFTAFLSIGVWANVILAVFNMVPIPPLDGSKVLFAMLPDRFRGIQYFLERYGIFLFFIFIFSLFRFVSPIMLWLYQIFTGYPFPLF